MIGTTGCAETVYLRTNNGTESIKILSDFGTLIKTILVSSLGLILAISWIYAEKNKDNAEKKKSYNRAVWIAVLAFFSLFFGYLFLLFSGELLTGSGTFTRSEFLANPELINASKEYQEMSQLRLDNQEYQQRQQLGADRYDLKVQIDKAKTNIASLKQDQVQKVLPLKQNYSQMYDQYYPQLAQQLRKIRIQTHEELLKNCEQYLELCSSINRVPKLKYYISKLDDKLKQIGANIIKLDDNVMKFEISKLNELISFYNS